MKQGIYIIAEAGVNHNGDLSMAKNLVDVAVDSGADAVKFQTFQADRLATKSVKKAAYQENLDQPESQYDMLKKLELSEADHMVLLEYCRSRHVDFLSTPFDIPSIHFLKRLGLTTFKIPSGELTNLPYLRVIGALNQQVILSTGMATLGEVELALEALIRSGTEKNNITLLHANSAYPTPISDVNLRAMQTLHHAFQIKVGYSDHTLGITVPIAAAAMGASVLEKHFTLDRNLPGPDHQASLSPMELQAMVAGVRAVELAMGNGIKGITPSEGVNKAVARQVIVAKHPIEAGERFTEENITTKRAGFGISPMHWDYWIGRKASKSFETDEAIQ